MDKGKRKSETVYRFGNNLYINLTNRCTNSCVSCNKDYLSSVVGANLILDKEPSVGEVIKELTKMREKFVHLFPSGEIVFCGVGEPTVRFDDLINVARTYRSIQPSQTFRLDTNGLGIFYHRANLILNREKKEYFEHIDSETGVIDALHDAGITKVNVSVNATSPQQYVKLCNPNLSALELPNEAAFDYVLDFVIFCVAKGIDTGVSFIDNFVSEEQARDFLRNTVHLEDKVRLIMRHAGNLPNTKPE